MWFFICEVFISETFIISLACINSRMSCEVCSNLKKNRMNSPILHRQICIFRLNIYICLPNKSGFVFFFKNAEHICFSVSLGWHIVNSWSAIWKKKNLFFFLATLILHHSWLQFKKWTLKSIVKKGEFLESIKNILGPCPGRMQPDDLKEEAIKRALSFIMSFRNQQSFPNFEK